MQHFFKIRKVLNLKKIYVSGYVKSKKKKKKNSGPSELDSSCLKYKFSKY